MDDTESHVPNRREAIESTRVAAIMSSLRYWGKACGETMCGGGSPQRRASINQPDTDRARLRDGIPFAASGYLICPSAASRNCFFVSERILGRAEPWCHERLTGEMAALSRTPMNAPAGDLPARPQSPACISHDSLGME